MMGNLQLNLVNIHLKRNFDCIDLLDKVLPSIFKNEVYWCSMVYETADISLESTIGISDPLGRIFNSKYALRLPGRETVKHYSLFSGLDIIRGEKSNIIEYDSPGKEIWRGEIKDDKILRFHIWIMERDSKPKKIEDIAKKFNNEINYTNLKMVVNLLRSKLPAIAVLHSVMSFITRTGAMILREDGDDLIGAYSGSLIKYSFKKPNLYDLEKDSANISLHLDKYEVVERIKERQEGSPGCIISDFNQLDCKSKHFDKLYRKLEGSLSGKK